VDAECSSRDGVDVIAMDAFTGFTPAATEELPDAVTVSDRFHVVKLAGDALDRCRRRVEQTTHGHRGRSCDPLYQARRTLHTGTGLLTGRQHARLNAPSRSEEHVEVEATWSVYLNVLLAADVLAFLDRPGTSNGPTEAINGRLEHLRGSALDSATRPTRSPEACPNPAASGPTYPLKCDEPCFQTPMPTSYVNCSNGESLPAE
jgi:transposase